MDLKLTAIIPSCNGVNYLTEAVEGIRRQEVDAEIPMAGGCSTDRTTELAPSLGCIVHSIPPSGQQRAKKISASPSRSPDSSFSMTTTTCCGQGRSAICLQS